MNYSRNKKQILFALAFGIFIFPSLAFADGTEPWQGAYTTEAFAGGAIRNLYCDLLQEVEGSFGALQFIAGAIGIFGYAAFGDMKKSYGLIISGIVAATMGGGISLYFGEMCGDSSNAAAKTAIENTDFLEQNSNSLRQFSEPAKGELVEDEEESSTHSIF